MLLNVGELENSSEYIDSRIYTNFLNARHAVFNTFFARTNNLGIRHKTVHQFTEGVIELIVLSFKDQQQQTRNKTMRKLIALF